MGGMKRMRIKKRALLVLSVLALSITSLLGCSALDKREPILVYNWGEYMSRESDTYTLYGEEFDITDVIKDFEAAYPEYRVVYTTFDENEKMYAKLETESFDVIFPSEYMVTRLMREKKLQELDHSKLPNVEKYMNPDLADIRYAEDDETNDKIMDYAVPYFYTTVGLIYNTDFIPQITTTDPKAVWGPLFDTQWQNRIGMYNSMRESVGLALNYLGYSMNTLDKDALEQASDMLIEQRKNVRPIVGIDELKDKYISGELVAGVAWSGDHTVVQQRLEEGGEDMDVIQYALPEGSNISVDMMVIPADAPNVDGAHAFINYMYDPEIALKNAVYVGYSTPHLDVFSKLPEALRSNPSYYPSDELMDTLEVYYSSEEIDQTYDEIWQIYLAN